MNSKKYIKIEPEICKKMEKFTGKPVNNNTLIKFDLECFIKSINWAWIWITPWTSLPSGRASSEKVKVGEIEFKKITTTPCFMFLNLQIWGKGILNVSGYHCGNTFDLSTPKGMALLLHEIFHIYQFRRNPVRMIWGYLSAIKNSIVLDHILFSHKRIDFEIEAITFENQIFFYLNQPHWIKRLQLFKYYR